MSRQGLHIGYNVVPTGRTRRRRHARFKTVFTYYEIRCAECGRLSWSRHRSLALKARP